jgi:hypothetical protein
MKEMISILLVFMLSFSALGQDSVPLNKGQAAPFEGVLFTTEKAQSIRKELIEKDQFKMFNEALLQNEEYYKTIISNNKGQIKLVLEQNTSLVKQAEKAGSLTTLEKALWVAAGVIGTSLAVMGAGSLAR